MNVAGSPILEAHDDDRARTLILSDLHLGTGGGPVLDWLLALLAVAQQEPASTRVLILGDLFEAYVGPKQLEVGAYAVLADRLAQASGEGVPITVLQGNRDFMLDGTFAARTGCRVIAGALRCRLAGKTAIVLHGDELLLRDVAHQRSKRWLRHPLLRGTLKRLPLWVATRLARGARKQSMANHAGGPDADPDRFEPVREAVAEAFAAGAELLVFGHVHAGARGPFGVGQEYAVLPAFDQEGIHLRAERELWFCARDGTRLGDFGPRRFAAALAPPAGGVAPGAGRLHSAGDAR